MRGLNLKNFGRITTWYIQKLVDNQIFVLRAIAAVLCSQAFRSVLPWQLDHTLRTVYRKLVFEVQQRNATSLDPISHV
jgi:hypothetical protein